MQTRASALGTRLAQLNAQLIRDEGRRTSMTVVELAQRMKQCLSNDYPAVRFEDADSVIGYALFRHEPGARLASATPASRNAAQPLAH